MNNEFDNTTLQADILNFLRPATNTPAPLAPGMSATDSQEARDTAATLYMERIMSKPAGALTPEEQRYLQGNLAAQLKEWGTNVQCVPLGRVNVATPGTNVPLATVYTPCARIRVSVIAGLTGKMYFGTTAAKGSTLVRVIKELWPNSGSGPDDSYEIETSNNRNLLNVADYAIDASVAGEGLIVSYWVA